MENGTGIVEHAKVGEIDASNNIVVEQPVKGNVTLSLDTSKDSDGDEVFEEAAEADPSTVGQEHNPKIKDHGMLEENNKENSDLGHEVREYEDMIGTPGAIQNSEVAGAKTEILKGEENHVEKEVGMDKIMVDETNGLIDVGIAHNNDNAKEDVKIDYRGVVDSPGSAGETMNREDGHENVDGLNRNPENNRSGKMSFLEALTSGGTKSLDTDSVREPSVEKSQSLELNDYRPETDSEKIDFETFPHESAEAHDVNTIEGSDNCSDISENEDIKSVEAAANLLKEPIHETSQGIKVKETGADHPDSNSNGAALHKNDPNFISSSGNKQDTHDNNSANLPSELKEDEVDKEEQRSNVCHVNSIDDNKSANLPSELEEDGVDKKEEALHVCHVNTNDDENTEPKKPESESAQVEKADAQDVNHEQNSDISPSNVSATNHPEEISGQTGLDTKLHTSLDNGTPNVEERKAEAPLNSSRLSAESSTSSQPELVGIHTGMLKKTIEEQLQEGLEDERKELNLSASKEKEVAPVTGGISSISVLDNASKVQEPVPQDTSATGSQVIKSNPVTTQPVGLRQTTPLSRPTSQNKERDPKSAINIPLAKSTSPSTPALPAGLGGASPLPEPSFRVVQQPRVNGAVASAQNQLVEDPSSAETEEYDETREKLQMIRVKFLRLAHRLGQTPHNVVVAQVLYRLGLAEQLHGRSGGRVAGFSFDRASAMAEQLEAAGQEPLDFTCTIMVLGKSGVGKSATINSIFDEAMFGTDAFESGTKKVQDIVGTVQGIRVRVIDTPGLLPSWSDQHQNEKTLRSVKKFINKTPPDIVLYLDRLDMQCRDFGDMPLLRTITETFGASIWFNAIVVLTHAASAPPEGPNGTTTSYDMFATQRSHVVQQAIRQAAGDMRLMNPVSLVENHSDCRTNRAGQRVLPNGQVWKPHLLLLSFASKILAEANTLLKLQDTPTGRPFASRSRSPPLPFLLSSLLQSRPEIKLPSEQFGDDDDNDAMDYDLDDHSESDEESSEYDVLPPFKTLTKAQVDKLSRAQRKAYYDELEYREKLFMKKQLKEERRRRRMMKKLQEAAKDLPAEYGDNNEEETGGASSVPVPMPDLVLPASFDSDYPTHRYRSLDSSNTWLVRAVLEPNGWDHDIGYDGINIEKLFTLKEKVPISFSGHISKDKKDTNLQMEVASSLKHKRGKATSLGFDMQSVGKDYAYTLRSETRFINHRINKAVAGLSATALGDVLTCGAKLEDKLIIGKKGQVVISGGAIYGRGEVAYGGSLEATLKDKENPMGRFFSTLGLSIMDWHGDPAIGCNSQMQIPIGRHTNLVSRLNINNRGSGQFSIKINSSEQLQIVLIGLVPLVKKLMGNSQQVQYG